MNRRVASSHTPNSPQTKKQNTKKKYCVSAPAIVTANRPGQTARGGFCPACSACHKTTWQYKSTMPSSIIRLYIRVNTAMPCTPTQSSQQAAAVHAGQNRPISRFAVQYSTAAPARMQTKFGSSPTHGRPSCGNSDSAV